MATVALTETAGAAAAVTTAEITGHGGLSCREDDGSCDQAGSHNIRLLDEGWASTKLETRI